MSLLQQSLRSKNLWRAAALLLLAGPYLLLSGQACNSNPNVNYCSPSGQTCGEPTEGSTPQLPTYPNGVTDAWPQGTTIAVNINTTGLTTVQVAAIKLAFQNWNGVGGVQFSVSTSTADVPRENYTYNVRYGSTNPNDFTGSTAQSNASSNEDTNSDTGYLLDNSTAFNPDRLSSCLDCFTKVMAHEIAHTFGLSDNQIQNSVIQDLCGQPNNIPATCGSEMPTQADIAAVTCVAGYTGNNQCNQAAGCSGGLTCEPNGTCGCGDPCDDSRCPGYSPSSCGAGTACQSDDSCGGGLVCVNGQCGCGDVCDDASCPGYSESQCSASGGGCSSDNDCPGGQVCQGSSCGCSDACDDPSCPGYSDDACDPGGGDPGFCYDVCDPGCEGYNIAECDSGCGCSDCSGDAVPVIATDDEIGNPNSISTPVPVSARKEGVHPLCE